MYSNIPLLYCVRWKSLVMSLKVAEQLGNQLRFTVPSHATCITTLYWLSAACSAHCGLAAYGHAFAKNRSCAYDVAILGSKPVIVKPLIQLICHQSSGWCCRSRL
jgi:hypothetical protein